MTVLRGAFAEVMDTGPAGFCEEGLKGSETNGIGYPRLDGLVGVVFDEEKGPVGKEGRAFGVARMHRSDECLEEGGLVFYVMKGIGHENAVETADGKRDVDEVGFDGDEGDTTYGFGLEGGAEIQAVYGAAGWEETGEGFGEEACATAEVGPFLRCAGGRGWRLG